MDLEIESLAADVFVSPPQRSPRWGLLLITLAVLMIILGLVVVASAETYIKYFDIQQGNVVVQWLLKYKFAVYQFLILSVVLSVYRLGHRLRVEDPCKVLEGDLRPAILYLRSFSTDYAQYNDFRTHEQRLVKLLRKVGPVIAIGKPDEMLPRAGAARLYAHERHWQKVVDFLLGQVGLVVLAGDNSPGILWEMHRLRERVSPQRVLLYNPRDMTWRRFENIEEVFHITLPAEHKTAQLITFNEHLQPLAAPDLSIKREFAFILPYLLALPPSSTSDKLRQLLTRLHKDANHIPPFRIHPVAAIPCVALGCTLLARSILEDVDWTVLALWLFELSAVLTIGIAASLRIWRYSQKSWLTTMVFCFIVSIALAWNVVTVCLALSE